VMISNYAACYFLVSLNGICVFFLCSVSGDEMISIHEVTRKAALPVAGKFPNLGFWFISINSSVHTFVLFCE
jgi:hypothetical protein